MDQPIRIIQISDMHLYADTSHVLLGVNTEDSLQAVIDLLKEEKFDLLIMTGDISQDSSNAAYARIAKRLDEFNVPVYWLPGNHDDPQVMMSIYPQHRVLNDKHVVLDNWHLILLDSHKHHAVEGYLADEQFTYLEKCLKAYPDKKAVVLLHHHPLKVGSEWLDNLGLANADSFWEKIHRYPQVKMVLFGHVHQAFEQRKMDIQCYSVPSTCFQFKSHQDDFGLEKLPPGYRSILLYPDGRIETEVKRAKHYVGYFDGNAKGY